MIAGLIAGIIMACLALSASKRFGESTKLAWSRAGIAFVLVTIITAIAPKVPAWIAVTILFIVTLAMMGYLVWWWMEEGSKIKELIIFAIMMLILMWIAKAAAVRIMGMTSIGWLIGSIRSIPTIVFFMSVGYMVADMIWFHAELEK